MSAFIVGDDHVNALVTYAMLKRVSYYHDGKRFKIVSDNAEEVGRILMDENVRSVAYRYCGRIDDDAKNSGAAYRFRLFPPNTPALYILKGCHCFAYQASETDDWETTRAHSIIAAIEAQAMYDLPGYDDAPWEITRPAGPQPVLLSTLARRGG